jgi:hypothetical protein
MEKLNPNITLMDIDKQSLIKVKPSSVRVMFIDSRDRCLTTGGKIVVADQIYRGRFLFASKNCENNKNTDFATLLISRTAAEGK